MRVFFVRLLPALATALLLSACATPPLGPLNAAALPAQWQAPLPHHGRLEDLAQWWTQLNDPLLVELIEAAQSQSPDIAQAGLRVSQARATRVAAGAALLPTLDANASVSRGFSEQSVAPGLATTWQAGLQTTWEIDVFGGGRAARNAAAYRLSGAQALWHDARVSVAAETANQTTRLRTCQAQLAVTQSDAASRAETSRLTDLATRAGFTAPATAALARASSADASNRVKQQRVQCDVQLKTLVALTGIDEQYLQKKMASAHVEPPQDALFSIADIPAQVISQRPDIFNADREVSATSQDLGSAQADRYPRLALSGSIGALGIRTQGIRATLDTWSIGPLALTLPLFDGGRRAANVDAARAAYETAAVVYSAKVRRAVAEVEQALLNLQSTADRSLDAQTASESYRISFNATQARYQSGLASLVELEDARRTQLAAQTTLVALQQERMAAWIALYRAAGGGWDRSAPGPGAHAVGTAPAPSTTVQTAAP